MIYTFSKPEFIADNNEVLTRLHNEYLTELREEVLDGSCIPETLETFSDKIFLLSDTPNKSWLEAEGIVWEVHYSTTPDPAEEFTVGIDLGEYQQPTTAQVISMSMEEIAMRIAEPSLTISQREELATHLYKLAIQVGDL